MSNAAKYIVVIGFLVLLGGVGVYGMKALQNNGDTGVTPAMVKATAMATVSPSGSPVSIAATGDPSTIQPTGDVDAQNAAFASEGNDSGTAIDAANPTADPTPTDTSIDDSVLANE